MINHKQINEKWLDQEYDVIDNVRLWINEHSPLPYSFQFWFDHHDFLHPSRILRKLRNLARWAPILWDDVDWDHSSLFAMLEAKLRFMRECQEGDRIHTDWGEVSSQLRTAEECMGRLRRDEYARAAWDLHSFKYPAKGKLEWIDLPDGMKAMPPTPDDERESLLAAFAAEDAARQADLDMFAEMVSKHSLGWWN